MNVTCDPKKDALNIRNHHISLNEAKRLEWDTFVAGEDARFAYNWRAISLRTATKREISNYAKA